MKYKLILFSLTFTLFLYFVSTTFAQGGSVYYVDRNALGGFSCNDAGTGKIDSPFCTIQTAVNKSIPGSTIYVRAGSYDGFIVSKSGTSGNYISIKSFTDEKVYINGSKGEGISIKGASYIWVEGFEVQSAIASWGGGIHVISTSTVRSDNNVIKGNVVHDNLGSNTSGILIEDASFNKVIDNIVYNNYQNGIWILSHSDKSPNGITGNEVIGNFSYNNVKSGGNSDGIKLEGAGTKNTLVQGNTVYGNSDDGIDTWNSPENRIINNVSYNHNGVGDGNGFKMGGSTTGGRNIVVGNIAYSNKRNGFDTNGSYGSKYYNNLAYNNTNFGFEDGYRDITCSVDTCSSTYINNIGYSNIRGNFSANKYTLSSHNNLWYTPGKGPEVFYNYQKYLNLSSFYQASGNRLDNPNNSDLSSLSLDPLFVNPTTFDFNVKSGSPTIDKGDLSNPGGISFKGLKVDIGAKEFESSVSTPPSSEPTPTIKVGDANSDNLVDEKDYVIWFSNFLKKVLGFSYGDFDTNGVVDGVDYVIWLINYGK